MPSCLLQSYTIGDIITANYHNVIYEVLSKSDHKKYVLKILSKKYFPKSLYHKIFSLENCSLLLPIERFYDTQYVYLIFPRYKTLSDILLTEELTWHMLTQFVSDIGQAISSLHEHGILHLDIHPQNIFMDFEQHFYLGDFSSAIYAKPFFPASLFTRRNLRTGSCPLLAPPEEYDLSSQPCYPDLYSYSLLLAMLLHGGNRPTFRNEHVTPYYPEIDDILRKILFPSENAIFVSKDILSSVNSAMTRYEQETDCQNHFPLLHLDADKPCDLSLLAEDSTPLMTPAKRKAVSNKSNSVSVPIYGFLLICSCIFLFTLYHVFSPKENSSQLQIDSQYAATSTSPAVYAVTTATPAAISTFVSDKKETPAATFKPKASDNTQKILFAGNRRLQSCNAFSKLSSLEELYLNDNAITSLSGLSHLTHLKVLSLSNNKLQDISTLAKLKSLIILDLSHNNRLKKISSLSGLKKLQYLILTNTNISKEEISSLKNELPLCTIFY